MNTAAENAAGGAVARTVEWMLAASADHAQSGCGLTAEQDGLHRRVARLAQGSRKCKER